MRETEKKKETISEHERQEQLSQRIPPDICSKYPNMFNDTPEEVTRIIESEYNAS